ncbi:MAG TPA: C4-dicarboxylate TRAP transporter substrate-binding protein [Bacillota bacterium]|nr:C4-dicarboxylate TRAP transporter substrate-binding protein [Bacillota bacterium]
MKSAKKLVVAALSVAVAMSAVFPSFAAPKKYVLKFNHVLAESEPFHQGFLKWAKRVNERTKGGLEVQIFPSAQLGVEEDIIEQLKQGANVGQNTDSARLGMYVPQIAVLNAPYFVETINEVVKLKNLPSIKKWEKELADKHGIKVLSFNWIQGLRHIVSNKPVRSPKDLKGQRIRTPGVPIWQESIRSIGASPVAMPFGEVYVGMQQGAVDGADLVYRNVTGAKLYEAAKYVSETKHILLINFEIVGSKFFNSLPANYQKILVEECSKAGVETSLVMEKEVLELKKLLKEKGMTIVEDVDIAAFKKAGEDAYKALKLTDVKAKLYKEMGKK